MRWRLEQINLTKWRRGMKRCRQKNEDLMTKLNQCRIRLISCNLIKRFLLRNNRKQALVDQTWKERMISFSSRFNHIIKLKNFINKQLMKWKIRIRIFSDKLITLNRINLESSTILNLRKMKLKQLTVSYNLPRIRLSYITIKTTNKLIKLTNCVKSWPFLSISHSRQVQHKICKWEKFKCLRVKWCKLIC